MKIIMVGIGYVGLVSGTCFAEVGNDVICVDTNETKINDLKNGIVPIYELGLEEMVVKNYKAGRLSFTTSLEEALQQANVCFICVQTPMDDDGSADLKYVLKVAEDIGKYMTRHTYIMDKSTVSVGTADKVRDVVQKQLNIRNSSLTFDVSSVPEFLKEGTAVEDCMHPDRVVCGVDNEKAFGIIRSIYSSFVDSAEKIIRMDIKSSEMTKYAANSLLATKISFINEIANICEMVGADVNKVRLGIGSDRRIGYSFINPSCGFGGSCFPKDLVALIKTSRDYGYEPKILSSVVDVNKVQREVLAKKVVKRFGNDLSNKTFAVWGLAYKPGTDDMRESSAITLIESLIKMGAHVNAYDPKAMDTAKNIYFKDSSGISYFENKYMALKGAEALILVTEWKEFAAPDFYEIANLLNNKIIFDGRNLYSDKGLTDEGFEYSQIGVQDL